MANAVLRTNCEMKGTDSGTQEINPGGVCIANPMVCVMRSAFVSVFLDMYVCFATERSWSLFFSPVARICKSKKHLYTCLPPAEPGAAGYLCENECVCSGNAIKSVVLLFLPPTRVQCSIAEAPCVEVFCPCCLEARVASVMAYCVKSHCQGILHVHKKSLFGVFSYSGQSHWVFFGVRE